jgi:hypothetical protein
MFAEHTCPKTIIKLDFYHSRYSQRVVKVNIDPNERDISVIMSALEIARIKNPSIVGIQYTLIFDIDTTPNNSADPDRYMFIEDQYFHEISGFSCIYDPNQSEMIDSFITSSRVNWFRYVPLNHEDSNKLMHVKMKAIEILGYANCIEITGTCYVFEFCQKIYSRPITEKEYYERRKEMHKAKALH